MKRSDCRTQSPPMRGERSRARRVWVALACAAVFAIAQLLPMKTAYADDANWLSVWNQQHQDSSNQFIVGAYSDFDAAAYVLGYGPSVVNGWDETVKARLSGLTNPFSSLAASMQLCDGWNEDGYEPQLEAYFGTELWQKMQKINPVAGAGGLGFVFNLDGVEFAEMQYYAQNVPDGVHCYALNTSDAVLESARSYVELVLSGGGGGTDRPEIVGNRVEAVYDAYYATQYNGQIGNAGTPLYFSADGKKYMICNGGIMDNQSVYTVAPSELRLNINLPSNMDYSNYDFFSWIKFSGNGNWMDFRLLLLPKGKYTFSLTMTRYTSAYYDLDRPVLDIDVTEDYFYYTGSSSYKPTSLTSELPDLTVTSWTQVAYNNQYADLRLGNNYYSFGMYALRGYDNQNPVEPPNVWPDPPEPTPTPTPPEPPEPTPNPPEPDPPSNPTPYTPPTFTPIGVTTPTETTDVIPWLRAILDQLKAIQSDMASHCQHIQDAISENADRIIETISSRVEWMADVLDGMFETLTDNINDLIQWLARQLQFDQSEPYNDTSLLYWIRKIYARLGNKPVNPVNPAEPGGGEQGFDFWAWLIGMLSNLIGGVLGDASDAVRTLLEGIKDKFPFSIPWDLMGILALLDAPRQTPDLTVTIPAINGWWNAIEFELDLSPYDTVAAAMRAMAMIWWVAELLKRTNWMIDDVLGSVTTRLVGGPVGRLTGAV